MTLGGEGGVRAGVADVSVNTHHVADGRNSKSRIWMSKVARLHWDFDLQPDSHCPACKTVPANQDASQTGINQQGLSACFRKTFPEPATEYALQEQKQAQKGGPDTRVKQRKGTMVLGSRGRAGAQARGDIKDSLGAVSHNCCSVAARNCAYR
eukprot:1143156-Pelagomonas_calceolata.AAC.4